MVKKRKYNKPEIVVKKIQTYFFGCLKNVGEGCTSFFGNHTIGGGCPT